MKCHIVRKEVVSTFSVAVLPVSEPTFEAVSAPATQRVWCTIREYLQYVLAHQQLATSSI